MECVKKRTDYPASLSQVGLFSLVLLSRGRCLFSHAPEAHQPCQKNQEGHLQIDRQDSSTLQRNGVFSLDLPNYQKLNVKHYVLSYRRVTKMFFFPLEGEEKVIVFPGRKALPIEKERRKGLF